MKLNDVNEDMLYFVHKAIIPDAFQLLPGIMRSREANAMLLAIGLQESRFRYRRQLPDGPANGFWQFEPGEKAALGMMLKHEATNKILFPILKQLNYTPNRLTLYEALRHNDVLAAIFARLLLWTVYGEMPKAYDPDKGWMQYLEGWQPGRPHPETWPACFKLAWEVVGR